MALREHRSAPAVMEAENFHAGLRAFFHNAPYNGVKARTVSAAGKDSDLPHIFILLIEFLFFGRFFACCFIHRWE